MADRYRLARSDDDLLFLVVLLLLLLICCFALLCFALLSFGLLWLVVRSVGAWGHVFFYMLPAAVEFF